MACVSVHHGKVIVSTTGSTSGPYVDMAKELLFNRFTEGEISTWEKGKSKGSWLFEICHKNDPHIVFEEEGAYYLGYRTCKGIFYPSAEPDGCQSIECNLGEALELIKSIQHKGFMMYNSNGDVCKLKSPYYIGKKKLMRMKDGNIDRMFADPSKFVKDNLPPSWDWWVDSVKDYLTADTWKSYTEQQRRSFIESAHG